MSNEANASLGLDSVSAPQTLGASSDASQPIHPLLSGLEQPVGTELLFDVPFGNQVKSPEKSVEAAAQQGDLAGSDDVAPIGSEDRLNGSLCSTCLPSAKAGSEVNTDSQIMTAAVLPQVVELLLRVKVTAAELRVSGSGDYEFLLVLPEHVDLDALASIEIRVMGPCDYCQTATFVGLRGRSLRYRVQAPGDTWTQADNGVYRIYLMVGRSAIPIQAFSVMVAEDSAQGNLLRNGDFKLGLANWVTFDGTEQVSDTNAYVGKMSLVLSTQDSGTRQTIRVKPGAIYQLTGYGCVIDQGYRSFGLSFFDGEGRLLSRSDVGCLQSTRWKDYFVVAIAPTHAVNLQVWTYQGCAQGRTMINGLTLRQIAPEEIPPRFRAKFSLVNAPLSSCHPLYARWQADLQSG